jgi:uncharacterized protein (TIRG00374 family)
VISGSTLSYLGRLLFSVALLTALFFIVDWGRISTIVPNISVSWIVIALLLMLVERVVAAFKWYVLLRAKRFDISFPRLFTIYIVGIFWGLVLPSSVGIDVVRGYYLYHSIKSGAHSVSSVVLDRILGLFALLAIGSVALFFYNTHLPDNTLAVTILTLSVLTVVGSYALASDRLWKKLIEQFPSLSNSKVGQILISVHRSYLDYRHYRPALAACLTLSFLLQIVRVLSFIAIAHAAAIDVPIAFLFLFVPLLMIIIMLPTSIGGIGLREGSSVAIFAIVGLSGTDGFVLAFTSSVLATLISLFGGFGYLFLPQKDELKSVSD